MSHAALLGDKQTLNTVEHKRRVQSNEQRSAKGSSSRDEAMTGDVRAHGWRIVAIGDCAFTLRSKYVK